jgi:RNA-directed DNA polymerase
VHERQEWVLRVDIADFFPSINFGRVFGLFKAYPFEYPKDVAALLAQICCYRNRLPQGAPTSPMISNFICRGLDSELRRVARSERCYYTRYADDICFSTQRREFPTSLALTDTSGILRAGATLENVITSHGFAIRPVKTRLVRRTQRQRVTGLVVNEGANVDRRYVRNLRNLLHIWGRYGEKDAAEAFFRTNPRLNWPPGKPAAAFAWTVQGRVQYVGAVKGWNSPVYRALAQTLQAVDPSYSPSTLKTLHGSTTARVYVEGATDVLHLKAAKAHFERKGEFADLRLELPADASAGGSSELLRFCEALAVTPQSVTCVCIFDRDEDKILRAAVGAGDMKDHGNNVIAVAIKPPPWRPAGEPLCIELLYEDSDLRRRDSADRRLYQRAEFNEKGRHTTESAYVTLPKHTGLIREEVLRGEDGASIGLTKQAFAQYVVNQEEGFGDVDFEGFRPTLELLAEAVARFGS